MGIDVEEVVLVDEENRPLGTMAKSAVHRATTPLHRAFSCFVFRQSDGKLLLQQRSGKKKTWPFVWSNSCCGHPALGETNCDAARRRLRAELGLVPTFLEEVMPYRYCFTRGGIMENEICPILVGVANTEPNIDSDEVEAVQWKEWDGFLQDISDGITEYSEWCVEETRILAQNQRFKEILKMNFHKSCDTAFA